MMKLSTQTFNIACKVWLVFIIVLSVAGACFGQTSVNAAAINNHPRLLMREGQENAIKKPIAQTNDTTIGTETAK